MNTSLKTGFAQFSLAAPPKWGAAENLGEEAAAPLALLARTLPLAKLKMISSSSSNYVVLTFLGEKKIYPFPELVEDKPHFLPPASEVCHA